MEQPCREDCNKKQGRSDGGVQGWHRDNNRIRYSIFALRLYGLGAFSVYETVIFVSLKFTLKCGTISYLFSETSSGIEVD